jgi:hypothetical protein
MCYRPGQYGLCYGPAKYAAGTVKTIDAITFLPDSVHSCWAPGRPTVAVDEPTDPCPCVQPGREATDLDIAFDYVRATRPANPIWRCRAH